MIESLELQATNITKINNFLMVCDNDWIIRITSYEYYKD
jgi:hypothetical protein